MTFIVGKQVLASGCNLDFPTDAKIVSLRNPRHRCQKEILPIVEMRTGGQKVRTFWSSRDDYIVASQTNRLFVPHVNRTHSADSYQSASRYLLLCQIMTSLSQFQHAAICSIPLLKASRCESSDLCPSAHTSQVMPRQGVSDPRDKRTITMPDGGVKRDRSVNETLLECRRGQCGQFVLTSGGYPKRPWKSAKGGCQ